MDKTYHPRLMVRGLIKFFNLVLSTRAWIVGHEVHIGRKIFGAAFFVIHTEPKEVVDSSPRGQRLWREW